MAFVYLGYSAPNLLAGYKEEGGGALRGVKVGKGDERGEDTAGSCLVGLVDFWLCRLHENAYSTFVKSLMLQNVV